MKISHEKKLTVKKVRSSWKTLVRTLVLTCALLLPPSPTQAANPLPEKRSIRDRVELVRETLKLRLAKDQAAESKLSFSARALAQWGNWGNWRNWGNWNNWNNWKNWGNWGNWGNI